MSVEAHRHGQRRGTAAEWTAANPILADGELGIETDTALMKIGDGVTLWTALPYANRGPKGDTGDTGPAGPAGPVATVNGQSPDGDGNVQLSADQIDPAPAPNVQNFTSSGTWLKPAGARWVHAEAIGGGGGNNGAGGGYIDAWYRADDLPATVAVTVGAGGLSTSTDGGTSSFGTLSVTGGQTNSHGGTGGGIGGASSKDSRFGGGGSTGGNSWYGGGGGQGTSTGAIGSGGLSGDTARLLGGNGGTYGGSGAGSDGVAPGGGGGAARAGARGQVRVTTYFG